MKYVVHYPPIGDIVVCTRTNCYRTSIHVSANEVKIITSPRFVGELFPILSKRVQWILEHRQLLQEKLKKNYFTPTSEIKAGLFTIRFVPMQHNSPKVKFAIHRLENNVNILYQSYFQFNTSESQLCLRRIIRQLLRKEANTYLPNRITQLAENFGFTFSNVRINCSIGRWGSCNVHRSINLSLYLMMLPIDLIDFVLVHELCHTEQMNHGSEFKMRMKSIFSDYESMNIRLKQESERVAILKMNNFNVK